MSEPVWKLEKYKTYYYAHINNHICYIFIHKRGWFKPHARNTDHRFKAERGLNNAKEAIYRVLKTEALKTLHQIRQHRKLAKEKTEC